MAWVGVAEPSYLAHLPPQLQVPQPTGTLGSDTWAPAAGTKAPSSSLGRLLMQVERIVVVFFTFTEKALPPIKHKVHSYLYMSGQ